MPRNETQTVESGRPLSLDEILAANATKKVDRPTWVAREVGDGIIFTLKAIDQRGEGRNAYPVFIGRTPAGTAFETFVPVNVRRLLSPKLIDRCMLLRLVDREQGRNDPTKMFGVYELHVFTDGVPAGELPEPDWNAIAVYRSSQPNGGTGAAGADVLDL